MLTCEDCYTICEGREQHPQFPACDEFDGQEEEAVPEEPQFVTLKQHRDLLAAVVLMNQELVELYRRFDTIVSAVVRAAGQEEER